VCGTSHCVRHALGRVAIQVNRHREAAATLQALRLDLAVRIAIKTIGTMRVPAVTSPMSTLIASPEGDSPSLYTRRAEGMRGTQPIQ
jgi:hypothetical protein